MVAWARDMEFEVVDGSSERLAKQVVAFAKKRMVAFGHLLCCLVGLNL